MTSTVFAIVKDGKIEPLSPIDFPEGTRISVTINDNIEIGEWTEDEWLSFSKHGISGAYGDDEPEYEIPSLEIA